MTAQAFAFFALPASFGSPRDRDSTAADKCDAITSQKVKSAFVQARTDELKGRVENIVDEKEKPQPARELKL